MARYLIPLGAFLVLVVVLWFGLKNAPTVREVPSPFIGKAAPQFSLPELKEPTKTLSNAAFDGEVVLLNVWATWCVSCRAEHEVLVELAATDEVKIYGLNYKDERGEALRWLAQLGDPYVANGFDAEGRAGIDWGVYGTPETFLIDKHGVVRHKYTGPISREMARDDVIPRVRKLKAEQG
ncbi:DsbE family thiol:disulfide interchange protein [Endothiovibrio diazotrophicus]